jgi:hypothetical protein
VQCENGSEAHKLPGATRGRLAEIDAVPVNVGSLALANAMAVADTADEATPREPDGDGDEAPAGHLALFNQQMAQRRTPVEWIYDVHMGGSADAPAGGGAGAAATEGPSPPPVHLAPGEGAATTPVWLAEAFVGATRMSTGKGRTKKAAQHAAAKAALTEMVLAEAASECARGKN